MAGGDVQVKFGADISDLNRGVSEAKNALATLGPSADQAKSAFDGLTESMRLIGTAVAIGGAIAGAVTWFRQLSEEMISLEQNSKEVGLTLKEFQNLKFVANLGGVNDDKFVSSLQQAAAKLNDLNHGTTDLSKFLDANNEKYRTANGLLIGTDEYIALASRLIAGAATEQDKFKAADLLGFSREWVQVLEKGPTSLGQATAEATKLGIALDDNAVHKAADFEREWNKSTAEWASTVKHVIIEDVAPALRDMIAETKKDWASFAYDVQALWGRISNHDNLERAAPGVTAWFDEAAAKISWSGFVDYAAEKWKAVVPGVIQRTVTGYLSEATLPSWVTSAKDTGGSGHGVGDLLAGTGEFATKLPNLTGMMGDLTKANATSAQLGEEWQKFPSVWKETGAEIAKATASINGAGAGAKSSATKFPGKEDIDAVRAEMFEMQGAIQLAGIAFEEASEEAMSSAKIFDITETEKTARLLSALQTRTNAQLAAAAQELANLDAKDTEYLSKRQQVINKSEEIEAAGAAKRKQIVDQERAQQINSWASMVEPIQGAWDGQLRGLLAGTTSWASAMKNIAADLVLTMIQNFEKLVVVQGIAKGLQAAFGAKPDLTGDLKSIWSAVGKVYAETAAFLAPTLGPLAVPAAAAVAGVVGAGALALSGRAEQGAWNVPATGVWQLHPGETVLPAAAAAGFRGLAEGSLLGGGAGGNPVNLSVSINAIDTQTGYQFMRQQLPAFAGMLKEHLGYNPSRA